MIGLMGTFDDFASRLAGARHVVALAGAGVSADSGVPTFRDARSGLWAKYDPTELASPQAFARDPQRVTQWYDHRRQLALQCAPNGAHEALATLEHWLSEHGARFTLLTQNVDRLHQRAGSQCVHEMHGTLLRWRCSACGAEALETHPEPFAMHPPGCARCGGPRRPCVVWFGEMLPAEALRAADAAVADCDVFLSLGTSAVVYPVAGYIERALARPGTLAGEINPEPTPMSDGFDLVLRDRAAAAVPGLVQAAIERGGNGR